MVKQFLKKKSKRQTCRMKYKIEKKVREHHRKQKKEAKKNPHKKKKDPGVPNSFPFKDQILKEAEERKRRLEEEREKEKERRKKNRQREMNKRRSLESLAKDAEKKTAAFEKKQASKVEGELKDYQKGGSIETSRKAYYKEFKKVIQAADVILQVLDARDPLGSRCPEVEEAVIAAGADKKLVLVLNKIDLVPGEIVEKWLKYLRNEFPAIAFKASTQDQRDNLSQSKMPISIMSDELKKSSRCLGADVLMKLLNNYCRNKGIKTSISVGVVGFPNTGKSSIINSLRRSKACNVGATPGVTKAVQEVQLDKHVKLLDSPGVVMATDNTDAAVILRNCVKIETLSDPVPPVEAILRRCSKEKLMLHYKIPNYSDVHEFLSLLAKRLGKLKKKGIPDMDKAGKTVLQDWTSGRITYYTHPPEQHTMSTHISAEVVTSMAEEFDIDTLISQEKEALSSLKTVSANDIVVDTDGPVSGVVDADMSDEDLEDENGDHGDDSEELMEDDDQDELKGVTVAMTGRVTRSASISTTASTSSTRSQKAAASKVEKLKENLQENKAQKEAFKKMKKKRKRADKLAGNLSEVLEGAMKLDSDQAYDFGADYK